MATFISRLVLVCTLSLPAFSSAITIQGNIHPERYTFFLTEKGGEMLRDMNNEAVNVKHSGKASASVDAQNKAAAANISTCCTRVHRWSKTLSATTVSQ